MSSFAPDFEWFIDKSGYRLKDAPPRTEDNAGCVHPMGIKIFEHIGDEQMTASRPLRIVRMGGEVERYKPLAEKNAIFQEFAEDVINPAEALKFVNAYGPLTREGLEMDLFGLEHGDSVDLILAHAAALREFIDPRDRHQGRIRKLLRSGGMKLGSMDVGLKLVTGQQTPQLRITPHSLLDALWLQAAQSKISGIRTRKCKHCGKLFQVGRGTGRRSVALHCSDQCKRDHNSRKRTKGA